MPRPIAVGQTVTGDLGGTDPKLGDNSFYDLWTFQARAGDGVTATLRSTDFDAFLVLGRMRGEDFEEMESDDDKGGGSDARVSTTLSEAGTYTLRVNSLYGEKTGAYTFQLASGVVDTATDHDHGSHDTTAPPPPGRCTRRRGPSAPGRRCATRSPRATPRTPTAPTTRTGSQGRRGERIVATMRSPAFDSYLQFGAPGAGTFTYMDAQDDRGGGNDSLMAVALPEDGQYVLRVNTIPRPRGRIR